MSTPDLNAFAKMIPGFDFLQNLTRQAGQTVPGMTSGLGSMSHWVAPTLDVDELDKRIQDLRAVHFWLDQNTKALAATIQALEVQKMTLATLKGMNVSLGELAEAFTLKPQAAAQPEATPTPAPEEPSASESPASDKAPVDPMQWWGALTQQFQNIAGSALRDMAEHAAQVVPKTAPASAPEPAAADADAPAVRKRAPRKTPASPRKGRSG